MFRHLLPRMWPVCRELMTPVGFLRQGKRTVALSLVLCGVSGAVWADSAPTDPDLDQILQTAKETRSSAVVLMRQGEVVLEWRDDVLEPIETMSVTKSVVALGVARMLTTGELASLDMPVADVFPEWRQGRKSKITVRHLMNHSSGLQNHPHTGEEIYPSPDFVQLALAAELDDEPGERFRYNNKATNLIAGLFPRLTGRDMAQYIGEELFEPLGIEEWTWQRDDAGNPHGMAGLRLHPRDLARMGQLLLDGGSANGQYLIAPEPISKLTRPGRDDTRFHGLLWWLQPAWSHFIVDEQTIQALREAGVDDRLVEQLQAVKGRYEDSAQLGDALEATLGPDWESIVEEQLSARDLRLSKTEHSEDSAAWFGSGYLGQYLVVVPESNVVGVRMVRYFEGISSEPSMPEFRQMVVDWARSP